MRGQVVVVKDFMGRAVEMTVWEVTDVAVSVLSADGYEKRRAGAETPWAVGVPLEDVYERPKGKLPSRVNWSAMTPLKVSHATA